MPKSFSYSHTAQRESCSKELLIVLSLKGLPIMSLRRSWPSCSLRKTSKCGLAGNAWKMWSKEGVRRQCLSKGCLWKRSENYGLANLLSNQVDKVQRRKPALNKAAVFITTTSSKPLTIFSCRSPAVVFAHLYYNLGLWFIFTDSLYPSIFTVKMN